MSRWKYVLIAYAVILLLAGIGYRLTMPGALFLNRYMDESFAVKSLAPAKQVVETQGMKIPLKVFKPGGRSVKTVLLVHGVHFLGYDEPRLLHFAEVLVSLGYSVVVPDIQDLKKYVLTSKAVDEIERSALWVLDESGLVKPKEKIELFGISFSGGLGLSAAARESLQGRIATFFSFGGHGDLEKTLEYLLTGVMPDGKKLPAHIYGQAVIARWFAEKAVPPEQADTLRSVLLDYLSEKDIGKSAGFLPPETKAIAGLCMRRNDSLLGSFLRERIGLYRMDTVLSPVRGPVPHCRIFLLHGSSDNVIPPSESARIARWAGNETKVTMLVSALIQHVELGKNSQPLSWTDYWAIIRFTTELFRATETSH